MKKLEGLYLVINPAMERNELLRKLHSALEGGIDILQVWNNWPQEITIRQKLQLIADITRLATPYQVPVLINEEWHLLQETALHGVHFDHIPANWEEVKSAIGRDKIIGLTAGNDLEVIRWAHEHEISYLSFCAMFPSASVNSCEIVKPDSVLKARQSTKLPLFLSGGIYPANLVTLKNLDFQGIAIISGIMSAENPGERVKEYRRELKKIIPG